jgi:two-component system, NarL family, response regulator LiaR
LVLDRINLPSGEVSVLSPRELDVLRLIAEGLGNKEIADKLEISLSTVKTHIEDILARLKVSDRTQAAVKAVRQGLL